MNKSTIAILGAVIFAATQANAGGMPPEYEVDANGVPLNGIEPIATVTEAVDSFDEPVATMTTAAMDGAQLAGPTMPVEMPLAMPMATVPPSPAKDHR